jgi:glycosyltransferase involved in cell wall biosynthesis
VKPLRVLIVADGLEPLLHHTVVGLADRGHQVAVVGLHAHDELDPVERFRLGRSVMTYGDSHGWPGRAAAFTREVARGAVRDPAATRSVALDVWRNRGGGRRFGQMAVLLPVLGRRPDVTYFEAAYVAAKYAPVLDQLGPKVVMCTGSDVRVMPGQKPWLAALLPAVFAQMGRIVCRSEDLRRCAVDLGAPEWRTSVLPPAATPIFAPMARPPRDDATLRLISVGRQHWVKGYEDALVAVALSRREGHDITLTIVGADRGAGEALRFAVADLNLGDAVVFAGPKSVAGVRAALARADAFVLSSVSEGMSRAAIEAMAMGLPVITTDVGGMPELVRDGVEGLLVPPRDPPALADAFSLLARDRARRAAMGQAAMGRAGDFEAGHHLARIEQCLAEVAAA